MDYCSLGSNQLSVSKLCLGTMTFGAQTDRNESKRIVSSAKDHGVNFIDTADVSQSVLLESLLSHREIGGF